MQRQQSCQFQSAAMVSVPSTGRSGLQLSCRSLRENLSTGFSTLYGSKWVATCLLSNFPVACLKVSVPSTGRSGLQLIISTNTCGSSSGFSTLYGSKWVATQLDLGKHTMPSTFQYPLRVEVGCNLSMAQGQPTRAYVSVPSTGRSGLQVRYSSVSGRFGVFQYPLRVEVGCNPAEGSRRFAVNKVSVPSTGRSGLQG